MSIGINELLNELVSHALTLGVFEKVNTHEYKSAPGKGLFCEIWSENVVPARSGLASTSITITFSVRLRVDMITEPQDEIDPRILDGVDQLMTAYSGDFELGGNARNVELNTGARADAGYLNQDSSIYRIMTITLPVTVNDVWEQAA
ncbi:hypothetical protein [Amycolatopsis sp. WQ 127309]|uniref:hypothetical protein n=1 Tax=Amycolatopsis sp. WQ 127309 TaxID=2932773 RepID=UPI001FF189FF|nr:hypothetical protein [Amycolatopsis sp. WQ 127309]UOZ10544.1 hypothetical protein MUY22_20675 [Amycolatopsis sp. WQ 127309]